MLFRCLLGHGHLACIRPALATVGPSISALLMLMRPLIALLGLLAVADAFQATPTAGSAARVRASRAVVSPLMQGDVAALRSRKAIVAAAALTFFQLPALAASPTEFASGLIIDTFTTKPKEAIISAEKIQMDEAQARKEADAKTKAAREDKMIAREERLAAEKAVRAEAKAAKLAAAKN